MLQRSVLAFIIALSIAPAARAESATGAVRAGNEMYNEGKYEEALNKYKAAQVETPLDERIMFNLGAVQYRLDRHEEALSEFTRSAGAEDDKTRAQSHYNAGNALYRNGMLEEAVEQYLKTLEIDPEDEDAKYNLEFVRREIRRRMNEQQRRQGQGKNQGEDEQSSDQDAQREQEEKPEEKREQRQQEEQDEEPGEEREQQQQEEQDEKREQQQQQEQEEKKQADSPERQEKKEQEQQGNSGGDEQPEPRQDGHQEKTDAQEQMRPPDGQRKVSDENLRRWLDAVEAETAENMKAFLRKQQPAGVIAYSEDW